METYSTKEDSKIQKIACCQIQLGLDCTEAVLTLISCLTQVYEFFAKEVSTTVLSSHPSMFASSLGLKQLHIPMSDNYSNESSEAFRMVNLIVVANNSSFKNIWKRRAYSTAIHASNNLKPM